MRYMLLIYSPEQGEQDYYDEAAMAEEMAAYNQFNADAQEAGVYIAGDALQPSATATSVRVRDGDVLTTDGPFAETKEVLGGYYMVECGDLDEAVTWASRIPGAQRGTIEVRPIMEFDQP
jgi:hypothetical protein